jgi:hypothetical protein
MIIQAEVVEQLRQRRLNPIIEKAARSKRTKIVRLRTNS